MILKYYLSDLSPFKLYKLKKLNIDIKFDLKIQLIFFNET
jgi:hypothetical protein